MPMYPYGNHADGHMAVVERVQMSGNGHPGVRYRAGAPAFGHLLSDAGLAEFGVRRGYNGIKIHGTRPATTQ